MVKAVLSIAMLAVLVLVGCSSVYYHQRLPILEEPDRPALVNVPGDEIQKMSPMAQEAVKSNYIRLLDYARKLEVAIRTYNEYADRQNREMDKENENE